MDSLATGKMLMTPRKMPTLSQCCHVKPPPVAVDSSAREIVPEVVPADEGAASAMVAHPCGSPSQPSNNKWFPMQAMDRHSMLLIMRLATSLVRCQLACTHHQRPAQNRRVRSKATNKALCPSHQKANPWTKSLPRVTPIWGGG